MKKQIIECSTANKEVLASYAVCLEKSRIAITFAVTAGSMADRGKSAYSRNCIADDMHKSKKEMGLIPMPKKVCGEVSND